METVCKAKWRASYPDLAANHQGDHTSLKWRAASVVKKKRPASQNYRRDPNSRCSTARLHRKQDRQTSRVNELQTTVSNLANTLHKAEQQARALAPARGHAEWFTGGIRCKPGWRHPTGERRPPFGTLGDKGPEKYRPFKKRATNEMHWAYASVDANNDGVIDAHERHAYYQMDDESHRAW